MVVDAINKDFSPQHMVQCYNQVRSVLLQQQQCALLQLAAQCLASPYLLRPAWCCQEMPADCPCEQTYCFGR